MPGSGPTDPDAIWKAIHHGATYSGGLLDGQHLVILEGAWELSSGAGYTLSQAAYDALAGGTVRNALIQFAGTSYQLAPRTDGVADLAAP